MTEIPPEIQEHYDMGLEDKRLEFPEGTLERMRTEELLTRHLPAPPSRVADIGGGTGVYAAWLAVQGHTVELVDLMPAHIEQARERFESLGVAHLATAEVGDARSLELADATIDASLLLGPLYHLTARADRVAALREGRRVLKPGGCLLAVGISKYASTLDGLRGAFLRDPVFRDIAAKDLAEGQHRNPTDDPSWFTTAYFHSPAELQAEVSEAGLELLETYGIEGPGWLLPDLKERLDTPEGQAEVLLAARSLEAEPAILGVSAHVMVVARKPG